MKLISFCNKLIEYSFYSLFFFVPLIFTSNTSELYEFNKMWFTFGIAVIVLAAWVIKMIFLKKFFIQKTPLDIPLILLLFAHVISTLFSLDSHISFWGYYSRFNGGLLSIGTYIFLYYAFVSNFSNSENDRSASIHIRTKSFVAGLLTLLLCFFLMFAIKSSDISSDATIRSVFLGFGLLSAFSLFIYSFRASVVLKIILISLISGVIVIFWGFPSHFGFDPTCMLFRGDFNTACWTDAFKPTIRAFSTLGQPAWFAAYILVLLPVVIIFSLLLTLKTKKPEDKHVITFSETLNVKVISYVIFAALLYSSLIFANTRAAYIAFAVSDIVLWVLLFIKYFYAKRLFLYYFLLFHILFLLLHFFFGAPVGQINKFTLPELTKQTAPVSQEKSQSATSPVNTGITDSGKIRLIVWKGAIEAWKSSPLFGTGVETFAFAYYKHRPAEHNMTSEWDYLYNKAHNEYVNYLATTGIFGLGSYLIMIIVFLFSSIKLLKKKDAEIHVLRQNEKKHKIEKSEVDTFDHYRKYLVIALIAGYISILITNFWGFSIVIINLYLFLIPAFVYILMKKFPSVTKPEVSISPYQWLSSIFVILISVLLLSGLVTYWYADILYAAGSSYDHTDNYQEANPLLIQAVQLKPEEPVYVDELAMNLSTVGAAFYLQNEATSGAELAKKAIELDDQVVNNHPNNVLFWKNRVRLFYTLAQGDPSQQKSYYTEALQAIEKANALAPTDAKISYNYAVLKGQNGDTKGAIDLLKKTIELKPDYTDAYSALGLLYHQLAIGSTADAATTSGKIIDPAMQKKADETYEYVLKNISPNNQEIQKTLDGWKKSE